MQQAPANVGLDSLSCVTTRRVGDTTCWAAGFSTTGAGVVVVNTTNAGVTWVSQLMPGVLTRSGAALTSISCPNTSHCAAAGWDPGHVGTLLSTSNGGNPRFNGPVDLTGTSTCADVAIITARGTGEPATTDPKAQEVGANAYRLSQFLPAGTTFKVVILPYPAVSFWPGLVNGDLLRSVDTGRVMLDRLIPAFIRKCPAEQLVLIGFSQGAAVIDQSVADVAMQNVPGQSDPVGTWITHITLFGDPMRVPGRAIDQSFILNPWPGLFALDSRDEAHFIAEPGLMAHELGVQENLPAEFSASTHGWTRAISWCSIGDIVCDFPGAYFYSPTNLLAFHNYGNDDPQGPAAAAAATHVIDALPSFRGRS